MRNILPLLFLLLLACSKKDSPNENQTGLATFIFSPGGAESQVSYYSFEEGRQILETKHALYQIRESVKIGDEIKLGMQTFSNPVGNFEIRLMINNRIIKTVKWNGSGDKTLYLTHRVTANDLNSTEGSEGGQSTLNPYYGELRFKFSKPLYKPGEDLEFYFYSPTNKSYVLKSFDGSIIDTKEKHHFQIKTAETGPKTFIVTETGANKEFHYTTTVAGPGLISPIFNDIRKDHVANSIGTFHANNGIKTDKWVPPLISNSVPETIPGYNWVKTLGLNTIDGFFGQYEYFFSDSSLDSIIVNHGNLIFDSELNTYEVYKDIQAAFGEVAERSESDGEGFDVEVDGFIIKIFVDNSQVYSKIKKIL